MVTETRNDFPWFKDEDEVIASFGQVQLVRFRRQMQAAWWFGRRPARSQKMDVAVLEGRCCAGELKLLGLRNEVRTCSFTLIAPCVRLLLLYPGNVGRL